MTDEIRAAVADQFGRLGNSPADEKPMHILCRGCSRQGTCQLGISLTTGRPGDIGGTVTFPARCEGGPGVVHGGMILAALDEVMGLVHAGSGVLAVTASAQAQFHRPVPVGTPLEISARLSATSADGSRRTTEAVIRRADGKPLASAKGDFVVRDPEKHFVRAAETHR
jgi:acyl-coenzyme A thioesterase PaaI-like protein